MMQINKERAHTLRQDPINSVGSKQYPTNYALRRTQTFGTFL